MELDVSFRRDDFPLWDRRPHAIKFQVNGENRNDFVVIPLHMKANSWTNNADNFTRRELVDMASSALGPLY